MLDFASQPVVDKHAVIGRCVRLRVRTDAERLRDEVAALPTGIWGGTGGRVGVHSAAEALFLRGYAPAEGDKPVEDRPPLDRLPYIRSLLEHVIPAPPLRALLARLPAGKVIKPHIDRGSYFAHTMRFHVPIETNDDVWMFCGGLAYQMVPGEIWALNNGAQHAVCNFDESLSRTHLIVDFLPTPKLVEMVGQGDWDLGQTRPEIEAAILQHQPH